MIKVITVGKKHETWIESGLERYQKRLKKPFNVEWVLLPHSSHYGIRARQEESEHIISRLKDQDYVMLLDETGKMLSSPSLAKRLEDCFVNSQQIVLIIGGAFGVNDALRTRANFVWSFSDLVFPHQLVRLMLIEQIYRSQEIASGSSYHHD